MSGAEVFRRDLLAQFVPVSHHVSHDGLPSPKRVLQVGLPSTPEDRSKVSFLFARRA